ncbi:MAG: hypothetical protein JW873_03510 [Candidatus Saganbacteria bacterium]|nr:hypothetical protein [Candidatus Saganbacteria bacterium]
MKSFIIVIGLLILLCSQGLAAPARPAWSLFSETAYNLKPGTWEVTIIGWANYGLSDRFQLGTNAILDMVQVPNVYAKCVLLEESDLRPFQIALSGSLYYPLAASTPISTDVALNVSRAVSDGNFIITGGIKQTSNFNDTTVATANPINTPGIGLKAGIITNQSDAVRFYLEAYSNWVPIGRSSEIAVGGDYVAGNMTVALGGLFYSSDSSDRRANFLPFINAKWDF